MKKIFCVMLLACVIIGAVFAQAKPATPAPAPAPAKPATPAAPAEAPQEKKNAVALDLFPLFKGFIASDLDSKYTVIISSFSYERLLVPHFSIGGDFDFTFVSFDGTPGIYFGLAAEGRYYPSANFDKVFLGATVGLNYLTIDGEAPKSEYGGFFGMTTSLKVGYKLVFPINIYVEPSMSYVLSKSSGGGLMGLGGGGIPTPLGWNGGLRFGFMF